MFAVLLLLTTTASAQEIIDLRDGAPATFFGGANPTLFVGGDRLGWEIDVGDLDGDGIGDLICSPFHGDGPISDGRGEERFGGGQVYVFFGRPRAAFDQWIDLTSSADIRMYGAIAGDGMGKVLAVGDIDADGFDDLLFSVEDRMNLLFGRPREQFRAIYDMATDSLGVEIRPAIGLSIYDGTFDDGDAVGRGLQIADINSDGYADIIAADYRDRGPEWNRVGAGAIYIIFGRPRAELPPVFDLSHDSELPGADVTIFGADASDRLGFEVEVGDVDGDGLRDVLFSSERGYGGAPLALVGGAVYGLFGRVEWNTTYDLDTGEFDFAIGGGKSAGLGYRLALGDIDGDGRDDIIMGSEAGILGPDNRRLQEARILFGRAQHTWPKWTDSVRESDVTIVGLRYVLGQDNAFTVAFSITSGDHDGDGLDELIIGAGRTHAFAGGVHVFDGRPRIDWPVFIDLSRRRADLTIWGADPGTGTGARAFDILGYTTAMGDIDGDGRSEILAAAPFADGPNNFRGDCGEIYVFFSPDTTVTVITSPVLTPSRVALLPNVPNPFNPTTTVRFSIPQGAIVDLRVYDAHGREVAHPLDGVELGCERCAYAWNANTLPSGVYFLRLAAAGEVATRKVTLVR